MQSNNDRPYRASCVNCTGQAELGVVGDFQRVSRGFDHGEHRAEDLFLLGFDFGGYQQ